MSKNDDYKIRILLIDRKEKNTDSSRDPNQQNFGANSSQDPDKQNFGASSSQDPNQQNFGANSSQNPIQQNFCASSSQNPNQQNFGARDTTCRCRPKCSLTSVKNNIDNQTMATCQEKSVMEKCICFDLKYKLIYLNLDRMLRRLPDIAVDKLNHKFIGLILAELDGEPVEGSPEDAKRQRTPRVSATDSKTLPEKRPSKILPGPSEP